MDWVFKMFHNLGGRRGGLMGSMLISGSGGSGFKPWQETLHCVLGQDTT